MAYATKQHQAILRCLESKAETALTAADLAECLRHSGAPVGLATIYRQLEKLEAAGHIHKITTEEGALYQYCPHASVSHGCFLLRCECCGRIVHLDCSLLDHLYTHLESHHHFRMDSRHTILTGQCQSCLDAEVSHGIQ